MTDEEPTIMGQSKEATVLRGAAAVDAWHWQFFAPTEFVCHCGCGGLVIDPEHMDKLERLRCRCGFALVVSSGYRCPEYNAKVSETGESGPHTTGKATDIKILGESAYLLVSFALACDPKTHMTGVGISQHGTSRFVHLDSLTEADGFPRPRLWSYK